MSAASLHATKKGWTLAVRNCGSWPSPGTLSEYVAAAQRAERETDRAIETWVRWRRRFNPDPATLELGSGRTNTRHAIAQGMLDQLNEAISLLIGPPAGSA